MWTTVAGMGRDTSSTRVRSAILRDSERTHQLILSISATHGRRKQMYILTALRIYSFLTVSPEDGPIIAGRYCRTIMFLPYQNQARITSNPSLTDRSRSFPGYTPLHRKPARGKVRRNCIFEPIVASTLKKGGARQQCSFLTIKKEPSVLTGSSRRACWFFQAVYNLPFTSESTTDGSASVDVSPSWSISLCAIFRRMRRMILPLLVLGRPGANCSLSGVAIGPITVRT